MLQHKDGRFTVVPKHNTIDRGNIIRNTKWRWAKQERVLRIVKALN